MPTLSKSSPHRILRRKSSRAPFTCMLVKPHLPPCRSHLPGAVRGNPKSMDAKVSVVRANEPTGASGTHNRQFRLLWWNRTELIIPGLSRTVGNYESQIVFLLIDAVVLHLACHRFICIGIRIYVGPYL